MAQAIRNLRVVNADGTASSEVEPVVISGIAPGDGPGVQMGYGPPSGDVEPGSVYIDLDTYDIYRADA